MQAPRRLQLRRGNTAAVSSYLGAAGELIVNTDTNTLYIHDGVTVGGIATTVNVSTITNQITAANVGMRGYVDFSIQSNIANIAAGYTNTNVKSYLGSFDGNIIPSANVAYSLGNITHQWKDLFVSNTTIYIGGVPVSISASGNLTVNGNTIPTVAYVNTQIANVQVDLSSYALNANVTSANVGLKGYVDSQSFYSNTKVATYLATGPINISNVTISDNYGSQWRFTDSELQLPSGNGSPYGRGPRISSGAGIQIYPPDDGDFTIQTYATGMGGSRQYTFTKLGNIVLSDGGSLVSDYDIGIFSGEANVTIGNDFGTWAFRSDGTLVTPGEISFYNTTIQSDTALNFIDLNFSNNVLLKTNTGDFSILVDFINGPYNWVFNNSGNIQFPDTSQQRTAWTGIVDYSQITNAYSNVQVATYLASPLPHTFGDSVTVTGNLIVQGNLFLNGNTTIVNTNNLIINDNIIYFANANPANSLDIGIAGHFTANGIYQHTGLVRQASSGQWKLFSNVAGEPGGTIDFTNAVYDDIHVGNITSPTVDGINANALAQQTLISSLQSNATSQQTTLNTLLANAATQSDLINGINANVTQANVGMKGYVDNAVSTIVIPVTYSNINVKAYTETMGFKNYSNVNVAAYLATATITTTGNITAQNISGNISITGNVTGTQPNVTIQAGSYSSVFDNQGNVSVPKLFTSGNIQTAGYIFGNGAFLTGVVTSGGGTNYSNVNVAIYLGNVSTNIDPVPNDIWGLGAENKEWYSAHIKNAYIKETIQAYSGGGYSGGNAGELLKSTGSGIAWQEIKTVNGNSLFGNGDITISSGASYSNVNVQAYTETMGFKNYSNVNVAAYTQTMGYTNYSNVNVAAYISSQGLTSYSNVQVATYLPTYTGNIANVRLGVSGVLTFADGTTLATASAIGGSTYGNSNVASYLITSGYVNTNSAYGNGNVVSYLTTNQYVNANSAYSNANVTSYLPTHSGNVGVNNLIGTTPNVTLVANSYSTTFDIYGNVAFGNAAYPVQVYATGGITTNGNLTVGGTAGIIMPNRPAFRVNGVPLYNGSQSTANVNLKDVAVSVAYNQGGYFDTTTGKFTAPVAGIYEVLLNARVNSSYSGLQQLVVLKNGLNTAGNIVAFWESGGNTSTSAAHWGVSGTVQLVAGDYLTANILAGNVTFDNNDNWCVTYLG